MKSFFKENMVLLTGVTLPLILTIVFFAATEIGKASVEPPQYPVIFSVGSRYNSHYDFVVRNDVLHFIYSASDEKQSRNKNKPRLFVYSPETLNSEEIKLPDLTFEGVDQDIVIDSLSGKIISDLQQSPDGYLFAYQRRSRGNLMTEVFGAGYRGRRGFSLHKDHNHIAVPFADNYQTEFVGWIVGERGIQNER